MLFHVLVNNELWGMFQDSREARDFADSLIIRGYKHVYIIRK